MIDDMYGITIETASLDDCPALGLMNRQLIDDEGNGNAMTAEELGERMRGWLIKGVYTGYVFKLGVEIIGYVLVDLASMYVRHFFISREHRRKGYGRIAVGLLFDQLGTDEIELSCLTKNEAGQAFWRSFKHDAYSVKFFIQKP